MDQETPCAWKCRHVREDRSRRDAKFCVSTVPDNHGHHLRHPLGPVRSARHHDRRHRANHENRKTMNDYRRVSSLQSIVSSLQSPVSGLYSNSQLPTPNSPHAPTSPLLPHSPHVPHAPSYTVVIPIDKLR